MDTAALRFPLLTTATAGNVYVDVGSVRVNIGLRLHCGSVKRSYVMEHLEPTTRGSFRYSDAVMKVWWGALLCVALWSMAMCVCVCVCGSLRMQIMADYKSNFPQVVREVEGKLLAGSGNRRSRYNFTLDAALLKRVLVFLDKHKVRNHVAFFQYCRCCVTVLPHPLPPRSISVTNAPGSLPV